MKTLRVLIVDDEEPARAKVRRLLSAEEDFQVVGEAGSGAEALEQVNDLSPDVMFLDIQMPGMSGLEVAQALTTPVLVVFVTAHDEHAVNAFELQAADYLLKPVTPKRFQATLARLRERAASTSPTPALLHELRSLTEALAARTPYLTRVMVNSGERAIFVSLDTVSWIEADRNSINFHTGQGVFSKRMSISSIAERLDPAKFLRINRSEIVRLDAVKEMHPWSHGDYQMVLNDGTRLMWSRRYRAAGPDTTSAM